VLARGATLLLADFIIKGIKIITSKQRDDCPHFI
jgi:hypothetical protein